MEGEGAQPPPSFWGGLSQSFQVCLGVGAVKPPFLRCVGF